MHFFLQNHQNLLKFTYYSLQLTIHSPLYLAIKLINFQIEGIHYNLSIPNKIELNLVIPFPSPTKCAQKEHKLERRWQPH